MMEATGSKLPYHRITRLTGWIGRTGVRIMSTGAAIGAVYILMMELSLAVFAVITVPNMALSLLQ